MNIRICGGAFFTMFVILVMNENFTNGMIELYVPPGGSTNKDDRVEGRVTATANTFAIFQLTKRIYKIHVDDKPQLDGRLQSGELSYEEALTKALKEEVTLTKTSIEGWNDDDKDWRAVRLIAILTTKLLAYADALQYSFFRVATDPAHNNGLKWKAIHSLYCIDYADGLNVGEITDVIKELLNGTRQYHGYSELVDNTFTQIRIRMEELERVINENRAILESRKKGEEPTQTDTFEGTRAPLTFLMNEFANMWYQYNTREWAEPQANESFKKELDETYEDLFRDVHLDAEKIEANHNAYIIYELFNCTEHFLALQFQIWDDFPREEFDALTNTYREFKTEIRNVSVGEGTQAKIVLTPKPSTLSSAAVMSL